MVKEKFIRLCNEKGVSPTKACANIGISSAAFSQWTDETIPRRATLMRMADYFGVSVDYLLGKEERNIYITGNPGTGKSTIITQSFDELLQEETKKLPASNEEFIEMLRQHNKGKAQIFFCGADGEVIELTPEEGAAFKNIVELRKKNKTD